MADIERSSQATWNGDLRGGNGKFSMQSGTLTDTPYSFATRFEHSPGTNPEELLAAAHAACYSMALSATLGRKGFTVKSIDTKATCILSPQQPSGFKITKMRLETRGQVEGLDEATFKQIAEEVDRESCPVSKALSAIEHEVIATLA